MTTVNQNTSGAKAYPVTRRLNVEYGGNKPLGKHWAADNIVLSHMLGPLSASLPAGEEIFVGAVRAYSKQITDPVLKKRVAGFVGQELNHGIQHRAFNQKLADIGYPLVKLVNASERYVGLVERILPARLRRAGTVAAEHYTGVVAARFLSGKEFFDIDADTETRNMLLWHCMEELEHKSVAFDVYRATKGPEWLRIVVMFGMWVGTLPLLAFSTLLSIAMDPTAWRPRQIVREARELRTSFAGLMKELAQFMKPSFHPDQNDDSELLAFWQNKLFGSSQSGV